MTMVDLFAAARSNRDRGMARAAAHSPLFAEAAYLAIEQVARRQVHVHVDDILAACKVRPGHPNAWGAVWMRAIKNKVIQRTNQTRPCKNDPRKHAHQYPVYFSLIFDPRSAP